MVGLSKGILILLFFIGCFAFANAQDLREDQLDHLNKQIRFFNETVNRMVIVFQMFEDYNSRLTKHVELPNHTGLINTWTHIPENLFADTVLVQEKDSPIKLFDQIKRESPTVGMNLNTMNSIQNVRQTIDFLNKDRSKINAIVANGNLEEFASIQALYEEFEEALDHYDAVRTSGKTMEKLLLPYYHNIDLEIEKKQVYTALLELHYDVKKIVRQLRDENQSGVINSISKLEKELNWARACAGKLQSATERSEMEGVLISIDKIVNELKDYLSSKTIPSEYVPYGKSYYYHNNSILSKINKYGTGYVWKLEQFFRKHNWPVLLFLEEPHFLKIVYSEKLPLEIIKDRSIDPTTNIRDLIEDQLPVLDNLIVETSEAEDNEEDEEEMPISIVYTETIRVDTNHITIRLQDHLKKDGDRVSISVNGQWIYERISLERTTRKIELEVKPNSISVVLIRADNVGWQPPNTLSIICPNSTEVGKVFIKKDLSYYEAIELRIVN